MAVPRFGNPVAGPIHLPGWPRPAGSIEFVVTSPFGPRDLNGDGDKLDANENHDGIDLANGRCGDPVYATAPGIVVNSGRDIDGAIFGILSHGADWRSYYWHLATELLTNGTAVGVVQIGAIGRTGNASGCHLHFTIKQLVNGVWIAVDPARFLWQNEEAMTTITRTPFSPARRVTISGPRTVQSYDAATLAKAKALAIGPAGSSALADASATIAPAPAWAPGGTVLHIPAGYIAHWRNSGTLLKDAPPPPAVAGITQAKYDADIATAKAAGRAAGIKAAADAAAAVK